MKINGLKHGDVSSLTSLEMPSGIFVELTGPHPDDIRLLDIAHNLANECRYGGTAKFSVAEHAVMVARELRRRSVHPVTVLMGLHHDDAEAYLKDIPRPLKRIIGPLGYSMLEDIFDMVIRDALKLDVAMPDGSMMRGSAREVKEADEWALGIEAATMLPSKGCGWINPFYLPAPREELAAHATIEAVRCPHAWDAREQFLIEHELCLKEIRRRKEQDARGS